MKKSTLLFAILLLCGMIVGCQNSAVGKTCNAAGNRYSVTKVFSGEYKCQLFDNNGETIYEYIGWKEPRITMVTENLLCFTIQTGTGLSTQWGFFYDYTTGTQSEVFQWILDSTSEKVILGCPTQIIVRNIFNHEYYTELTDFYNPIADTADAILEANFSEDGSAVVVKYVADGDYNVVSQEFCISGQGDGSPVSSGADE